MATKKDNQKNNQPHSGVEGEAVRRAHGIWGTRGADPAPRALPVEGAASRGLASARSKIEDFAESNKQAPTIDTGWRSLIERRESPRFPIHLPVTLRHNGKLIPATTENVSCGGMSLHTAETQLTIGGRVEVVVDLTELDRDVTLRGTVVRLDPQDSKKMGIQFINLLSGGHDSLQRFLKKLQK